MDCVLLLVLLRRPSLPLSRDTCVFDRAAFALIGGDHVDCFRRY